MSHIAMSNINWSTALGFPSIMKYPWSVFSSPRLTLLVWFTMLEIPSRDNHSAIFLWFLPTACSAWCLFEKWYFWQLLLLGVLYSIRKIDNFQRFQPVALFKTVNQKNIALSKLSFYGIVLFLLLFIWVFILLCTRNNKELRFSDIYRKTF